MEWRRRSERVREVVGGIPDQLVSAGVAVLPNSSEPLPSASLLAPSVF